MRTLETDLKDGQGSYGVAEQIVVVWMVGKTGVHAVCSCAPVKHRGWDHEFHWTAGYPIILPHPNNPSGA
jgi:hypothetical protein